MILRWEKMQLHRIKFFQAAKVALILLCFAFSLPAQDIASPKAALLRFEKFIEEGKLSAVESDLFSYVIKNPTDAQGFALMAKLRLKQNRPNEAKSLSNRALALNPDLLSAKISLALAEFQLGEALESRAVISGISENELRDYSTRLTIVEVLALIGDCPSALKLAEKLPAKIKNSFALPIRARCFLESNDRKNLESLIPIAKTLTKNKPTIATRFADVLSKGALHKEAAELLRAVNISNPRNVQALLLLAKAEIYLKQFAPAKKHLAQAERLNSETSELFFVKSLLEGEQGNYLASLKLLEKPLAEDPENTELLRQFVFTAMRANRSGDAVRAAERLIKSAPDNPEYLYLFGAASLQNNDLMNAETSLKKYLESRPNDSRGCLALGLTFAAQTDKIEEARQQLQHCLVIDPNDFEASYQLGFSFKTQGESEKAIEYFERTIKLFPNHALALRDLGTVYVQTGAETKARPLLEKAVTLNPNDADAHFQLSRLYNIIGEHELGKKHLQIFQKLKNPKKDGM